MTVPQSQQGTNTQHLLRWPWWISVSQQLLFHCRLCQHSPPNGSQGVSKVSSIRASYFSESLFLLTACPSENFDDRFGNVPSNSMRPAGFGRGETFWLVICTKRVSWCVPSPDLEDKWGRFQLKIWSQSPRYCMPPSPQQRSRQAWITVCSNTTWHLFQRWRSDQKRRKMWCNIYCPTRVIRNCFLLPCHLNHPRFHINETSLLCGDLKTFSEFGSFCAGFHSSTEPLGTLSQERKTPQESHHQNKRIILPQKYNSLTILERFNLVSCRWWVWHSDEKKLISQVTTKIHFLQRYLEKVSFFHLRWWVWHQNLNSR